jgi:hypothetical protein
LTAIRDDIAERNNLVSSQLGVGLDIQATGRVGGLTFGTAFCSEVELKIMRG